jgi:hypothetical protein
VYSINDINALQLSAKLNLEKALLPGRLATDILPEAWKGAWKNNSDIPTAVTDPWKNAYFYRIATYNVV